MPTNEEILTWFSIPRDQVSVLGFVVNLLLAAAVSYLLFLVYVHCGRSLSNRSDFGKNFVLIATTTMLIISIVKSSLALSLGLVGALSIVRFRAAIKEPEELSYLFLAVAIGLGFGANQGLITMLAFGVIVILLWLKKAFSGKDRPFTGFHLHVSSDSGAKIPFGSIRAAVDGNSSSAVLKRLDESKDRLEASFQITFDGVDQMEACHRSLLTLDEGIRVSLMDNRNLTFS